MLFVYFQVGVVLTLRSDLPVEGKRYFCILSERVTIFDNRHRLLLLEQSTDVLVPLDVHA